MKLAYRTAVKDDANLLIDIYNASFYEDYVRYGMCPAYGKTKEEMESLIETSAKYIILNDTIPVGAISIFEEKKGCYYLGCLCIIPEYQGKGIGTQAFQYILSVCQDWKQITLVTPANKEQNVKFYTERCGFHIGEKMMDGNVEVVNFYMNR